MFVASQSSCFFLCSREQIRQVENRPREKTVQNQCKFSITRHLYIVGKVVAAVWWMTGTIFVATYTANLAAFLTISKNANTIRSLEDLVNQDEIKYGTVQSSQPSQFFERSNIPLYQKMWSHMQSSDTLVVGCL